MLRVHFSVLALVGLFVVSAGFVPGVFSQSSPNVISAIAVEIDITPPAQSNFVLDNASHVLLTDHYTQPTECPLPVVELGVDPVRVLPTANTLLDIGLFVQAKSAPECVRQAGAGRRLRADYEECKENLKCEGKGGWYTCRNERGDEFSTCNPVYCGM